ncbi:hypothetical protein B9N66_08365 [Campylobacter concisus]|uniref:hypothetical protein n=1 Tax=Campylobacter concisus TaxID=199 RepID=UPI000B3D698B|nr:hypothetical protein [Campylobacter concisus]OUT08290.1 hypothetical protein B9N66_08365 [Campylobacter concisus]
MKIFKAILVAASAVCYLNSAILPQSDWSKKDLKGEVKSMTATEYEYSIDGSGALENTRVKRTEFNENGYILQETEHINGVPNSSVLFEYGKDGLIRKKYQDSAVYLYEYEFDGENLVETAKEQYIEDKFYPRTEKTTYGKDGKMIARAVYSGRELVIDDSYVYDEKGVLTRIEDNMEPRHGIEISFERKPNGEYEKITQTPNSKWVYYYAANGDEMEYTSVNYFGSEAKIGQILQFKDISRDERGNLTHKTSVKFKPADKYYENGDITEIGLYKKLEISYEYY